MLADIARGEHWLRDALGPQQPNIKSCSTLELQGWPGLCQHSFQVDEKSWVS
jgi:hypothetical protein